MGAYGWEPGCRLRHRSRLRPAGGRSVVSQAGHVQKNWQASSGISAVVFAPQAGQVMVEVSVMVSIVSGRPWEKVRRRPGGR